MLISVKIRNLAVIEEAEVAFGRGFTVVTGETGAGKSIMVGAIGLLLGERASADLVRTGEREAVVEGVFDLADEGPEVPEAYRKEGGLVIRRVVSADGRSRAYINGAAATVAAAGALAMRQLDISSQHQHQTLAREEAHCAILDAYGATGPAIERYAGARTAAIALVAELAVLRKSAAERAQREDYLAFQLKELRDADPRPGEDEALAAELQVLRNAGKLSDAARGAEELIYSGDGAACERARKAAQRLRDAAGFDPRLSETAQILEQAVINLDEAAANLRAYAKKIDFSPDRLEEAGDRLAVLKRLIKKHAPAGTLADVTGRRDQLEAELKALQGSGERIPELETQAAAAIAACLDAGKKLSAARAKAAAAFAKEVTREIGRVAMPHAQFVVPVETAAPDGSRTLAGEAPMPENGFDRVTFLFSANPGEDPRALHRIASGGELSRLMLAVKRVIAARDPVPLYIFDEVDAGIGGAVAEVVGRHLREISARHQVVCITHLPQIAAVAARHLRVSKAARKGRTYVDVEELGGEERVKEIARMLGGVTITETTLTHARELLEAAAPRAH